MTDLEQRLAKLQKQFKNLRIMGGEGVNVHGSMRTGYAVEVKAGVAQSGAGGSSGGGDVFGCTDPMATNFNPDATIDDGSCIYDEATGACCIGPDCSIGTETECTDADGVYQGDDTTCEADPCIGSITVDIHFTGYFEDDRDCPLKECGGALDLSYSTTLFAGTDFDASTNICGTSSLGFRDVTIQVPPSGLTCETCVGEDGSTYHSLARYEEFIVETTDCTDLSGDVNSRVLLHFGGDSIRVCPVFSFFCVTCGGDGLGGAIQNYCLADLSADCSSAYTDGFITCADVGSSKTVTLMGGSIGGCGTVGSFNWCGQAEVTLTFNA